MRSRNSLALLTALLAACGGDAGTPFAPHFVSGDGGSRGGGSVDAGASDAGADPDDPDQAALFSPGNVLAEVITSDPSECRLQAVTPGPIRRSTVFDCDDDQHVIRRSDGAHFYVRSGQVYRAAAGGHDELQPTSCDVAGRVDFDAENRMYYRCQGGTTAALYRDDDLVAENVVAEFEGALDDGRILYHGFEQYRVLDADGAELDAFETPPGWTALEDATTVAGDEALMLFVDDDDQGEPRYVLVKYGDGGFSEVVSYFPEEPPPSNFGRGHRVTADGALFVALEGEVRAYDPSGSSDVVWSDFGGSFVRQYSELVYVPE